MTLTFRIVNSEASICQYRYTGIVRIKELKILNCSYCIGRLDIDFFDIDIFETLLLISQYNRY